MTRPDVAIISPFPGANGRAPVDSGVAPYTASLVEALGAEGLAVHVIAQVLDGEPVLEHWDTTVVERAYRPGPRALLQAALAAVRTGARVVHLQHETFLFGGPASIAGLLPALVTLRSGGRRSVVTLHQVVMPDDIDRSFTSLHRVRVPSHVARVGIRVQQRAVCRLSTVTVVHAPSFADVLPGAQVVPVGLTVRARQSRAAARRTLQLPGNSFVVVCFGFVAPYKGLETALEAAALTGSEVKLVVAGGEHPRLRARGDGYAAGLEARFGQIARFTGYVPSEEVPAWFSAADVMLLPYPRPFAGSGVLAEALGYGTPVLCSPPLAACLGLPAPLVAPLEPVALARRLLALAKNRSALASLRSLVEELAARTTWREVARRHAAIYAG